VTRVPGTAVFLVSRAGGTPIVLLHHVKHNHVLHEQLVLLNVQPAPTPQVATRERVRVRELGQGFYELVVSFGFMEAMDVPAAIEQAVRVGLLPAHGAVSYFLGRETLLVSRKPGLALWRKWLFIVMARNSRSAASFFQLPPNRVVELGAQVEL
jgi:KUP system potassium uptake protein